jgi:TPP-dependent trihydroxycyclohexane-1,2-dione (THcHDO) dehydratase
MALWCKFTAFVLACPALIFISRTYAFRLSQRFYEVVKAEFSSGFFENFRSGQINEMGKAVFTRSEKLDFFKAGDRQKICRMTVAVLTELHNLHN